MALHPGEQKRHVPEETPVAWDPIRRALEENEDWYRDLVEHSQDLLCVHDLKGRFLSVNPVPARLLGYSVNEVLQKPMREFVDPQFRDQFDAYLREIERAGVAHGLLALLTRSGEQRIWEYHNTLRTEGVDVPIVRGIAHDVTDRVRAEKALRTTNERLLKTTQEQEQTLRGLTLFRTLLDQSSDAIKVVDPETLRILDVNERTCLELGYSREEMLSMTVRDIDPNVDEDSIARIMERTRESGFAIFERTHRRKDGTTFPVEVNLRLAQLDRKYLVTISRNITERKRAEQALRETEARERTRVKELETLLDALPIPVLIAHDPQCRHMTANRMGREYLRLQRGANASMSAPAGERPRLRFLRDGVEIPPDQLPMQRAASTGRPVYDVPVTAVFEDGTQRHELASAIPLLDENGNVRGAIGAAMDITERKRAEEGLRASEERVRLAQEVAKIGVFERNLQTGESTWSRETEAMFGLAPGEFPRSIEAFLNLVHVEDRPSVACLVEQSMQSGDAGGEWRVVWPDGTVHWIAGRWRVFKDERGRPVRIVGMDFDITERKQAEEALRESEERYRSVVSAMAEGVLLRDADGRILACNRSFEQMMGVLSEQMVGTTAADWEHRTIREDGSPFPGGDHPAIMALRTGKPQSHIRMGFRRQDGGLTWISVNAQPIFRSGESKPHAVVTTFADITKQKQAEEAIAALVQQVHVESSESFFASMAVQLAKCLEADYTVIGELIECDANKVQTIAVCNRGTIVENFAYDLAHTPCEGVMEQGACSYASGVAEVFPDDRLLKELKVEGYVGTPLRNSQGRVVGIMLALYTRPMANPKFAEMILQLFSTRTAGQIERKHNEEALRQSEAELRQAQRIGQMGSWYRDLATDTVIFSEQLYRLLRIDPQQQTMQAGDVERFLSPESRQRIIEANEKLFSTGERDEFEVEFRCPDETSGWALLYREAVRGKAGNIVGIRGVALDITERKQSEEALRRSEERFRVALKNSPISVFNQARDLRYTWMYNAQVPGPSGHLGKTPIEFFGPEEGKGITEIRQRVLDTGVGVRHEVQVTENGKKHYFDTTIEPVLDATGAVIGLTGASTDVTELRETTEALRDAKKKLTEEKLYLEQEIDTELGFGEIVGRSKALQAVMENVGKVATSNATVLLLGETGSGKELVARAIHRLSLRVNNSFIKMNCAAIPSGLLESELFGNEKGAFTGAVSKKIGRLELADKGTLFLDEIGEISLALQPKLLRVLQDQEFERLGGTQTLKVDFRLIAATNRDLADLVREMEFRSDLYYRLNVFPIVVPPLRDRRDDIPILVEHFVQKCSRRMKKTITSIPKKTMDTLTGWEWPGNVRELENFIERSVILTHGSVLAAPIAELRPLSTEQEESAEQTLEAAEREHILRALRESHGQIGGARGAAVRLGLKRTTLQSKLKQLGINPRTGRTEH